ncbi:MAG TPA: O-antigen ligase family protein [Terriglobales bacterium]
MTTIAVRHRTHLSPAAVNESALSRALHSAACYVTIALIAFGPLAFGAVEAWAMFVLHVGSVLAFVLWTLSILTAQRPQIELQLIHLPPFAFACIIIGQIFLGGSAYRHETVTQFMNFVAYGLVFLVATDVFRNEREARWLCLTLAVLGFSLALLGSVQEFTAGGKLYWVRSPRFGGPIFGPYVNRNHYAGAMELLFPFALMSAFKPSIAGAKRILLGFAAVLMIATVFLCGSRGGFICVVLQVFFVGVLLFWRSRHVGLVLALTLVFILTAAFGTWLGSDRLIGRLGEVQNEGGRLQLVKDSMQMFEQRPLVGWGLGTFPVVYPKFRSFATDFYVNEAHNDFVQLLVETGIIGFSVGIGLLILVFRNGLRQVQGTVFGSWRTVAVSAALIGVVGLSIHSLFDFNLQIPANALLFYVLCAVAGSARQEDADVFRRMERSTEVPVIDV